MTLDNEVLESQLSIAELLSSMFYGEGELEIDDETAETITALRDFFESPASESPKSFRNLHIVIFLAISESRTLALTVVLHLRARAPSSTNTPPLLELSIKYSRSPQPDVQGAEDGRDWLMQTIEHLQSDTTKSKLQPLAAQSSIIVSTSTTPISLNDTVTRAWFYLPSLSTRSKRDDIVNLAPSHRITGFVLAGKPGLLCIESPQPLGPDAFIAQIKTESWADIPSHQKKITERYRETGVKRAFEGMDEVTETISTRGARANRGDMGEVRVFLEEKGLKGVLEIVLGANEFK
ncbi:hypothetical protein RhiJN_18207 [Ceratobasidium sp. AG-Ba]|nr:hypothetical protein RhiJN_18207 [Ceratobasidium sp. AG-Ba]